VDAGDNDRAAERHRIDITCLRPDDMLEQLPPFDLPVALARTNGKTALLRKMLLSFGDQYQGGASEKPGQLADVPGLVDPISPANPDR
jgi:hypothetical protein